MLQVNSSEYKLTPARTGVKSLWGLISWIVKFNFFYMFTMEGRKCPFTLWLESGKTLANQAVQWGWTVCGVGYRSARECSMPDNLTFCQLNFFFKLCIVKIITLKSIILFCFILHRKSAQVRGDLILFYNTRLDSFLVLPSHQYCVG